ncbi:MAG: hypothetical protein LLG00_09275 [Planctomycetaceae bacterium]|nr:hypothetical protein [Planctomycetaceae bacterium]
MNGLWVHIDEILRCRQTAQSRPARAVLLSMIACIVTFGMVYGAVMGSFGGIGGQRLWQAIYSALKVPLLLVGTSLIAWPSFFVLNTLAGLRGDFVRATTALMAAQAGLAIVLASLAPLTIVWYASSSDYGDALRFNGVMFAIACLAGQWLLRDHYRVLIEGDPRHRRMFWIWLGLYVFVAIQMAWVLRPFVGDPNAPVEFLRREKWGNAYLVVVRLIYEALVH